MISLIRDTIIQQAYKSKYREIQVLVKPRKRRVVIPKHKRVVIPKKVHWSVAKTGEGSYLPKHMPVATSKKV